jgi:RNA polymerase sigma factor (sigma-70 family)
MPSLSKAAYQHTPNAAGDKTERRELSAPGNACIIREHPAMDPESSFELIRRAQAGDASALDQLLARYRPRLRRWASGRLPRYAREIADTEDLVQDVLVGTFRSLQTFEQRGEWALQAYLRRALMNRVRDELRRTESRPRRSDLVEGVPSTEASPLEVAAGKEVFAAYELALASLDDLEREAVIARLELGCSYQEIAALVDKPSVDAARMMVARALDKLARLMPSTSAPAGESPNDAT